MSNLSQFLGGKVKRSQTFTTSGTFTPSATLLASGGWVEVTAVGGGGGGAVGIISTNGTFAGGGGGGAVVTQTLQLTGATGVQVGAGGSVGLLITGVSQVGGNGGTTTMFDGSTGAVAAGGYGGSTGPYAALNIYNTHIGGKSGNNSGAFLSAGGGAGGPAQGSIGVATGNYYTYAMGGPGIGGYGGGGAGSGVTLIAPAQNAGGNQTGTLAGYSSTGTPPNAIANTGSGGGGTNANTNIFTGTSQGIVTLNAPTNSSNTTIGVTSNTNINVGQTILIDSEYVYVRALVGATGITVTRGSANIVYSISGPPQTGFNTTAATHTIGATGTWTGMNSLLTIPYNASDPKGGFIGTEGGGNNTIGGPVSATNGFSTLAVTIGATETSITVNGAYFANSQVIQLDAEQMLVTAGGGTTTLTVTRGYNGTTAASHTAVGVMGITSMKMTLNTTVGSSQTLAWSALTNGTFFWLGHELCQVTSGGGTSAITFTRNINKLSAITSDVYGFTAANATFYGSLVDLVYYGGLIQGVTYKNCIVPATGILPTSASVATGSYLLGNYSVTNALIAGIYPYNLRWCEPALVLSSTGTGPYYNTVLRGTGATGMNYNLSANSTTPIVTPFNFYANSLGNTGGAALLGATQFYVNASTTSAGGAGGCGVCIVSWFE